MHADTPLAALLSRGRLVCAHRGARSLAPENTMPAAEAALGARADMWEMDVQRTSDGQLVVFHDDTLERTTNVAERPEFAARAPWPVAAFSLAELRGLDAGSWFAARDPHGAVAAGEVDAAALKAGRGARIPLLAEALAFTVRRGLAMNLEIKDQIHAPGDLSIVPQVLDAVRAAGAEGLVLLSSFNHTYVAEAVRLAPALPCGALVEERHAAGGDAASIAAYLKELGAAAYHPDDEITDLDLVRGLFEHGVLVNLYTVNDMARALALFEAGATTVITDYPQRLRAALEAQG
ncbi:glycerophosphoryl diester phosphodiesterase [Desulfovibrio sp. X2]|uniref:glycerophosphodiester phosphodiesterase n=1 Tax=Desulfovibrio sp. X2 TaxID=941449 RepID=UPI0003586DB7|nr:glycerophosphodiester phosphodiesterase family protein [Desulfovibrio sp. X2]EPR40783.1 glycerophosphoryl diester phosphodiesterase [Desulfovibrio sp. X2]